MTPPAVPGRSTSVLVLENDLLERYFPPSCEGTTGLAVISAWLGFWRSHRECSVCSVHLPSSAPKANRPRAERQRLGITAKGVVTTVEAQRASSICVR